MRARFAAWLLVLLALVCGLAGAGYAEKARHWFGVEPSALGSIVADAMMATVLLVVAGAAVVGLVVLRGVAEMLTQVREADAADRAGVEAVPSEPGTRSV
jgi:hypothetical protein